MGWKRTSPKQERFVGSRYPGRRCSLFISTFNSSTQQCSDEKELSRQKFGSSINSKSTSITLEAYFEHSRSIPRARHDQNRPREWSNHNSIMVETYREHSRNISRTRFEACLEHGRKITGAQLKQTSSTIKTDLEHVLNFPHVQWKPTASKVEKNFELSRSKPQAWSKHTSSWVETFFVEE